MKPYLWRTVFPNILLFAFFTSCSPVELIQGTEKMNYLEGEKRIAFHVDYSEAKVGEQDEEEFIEEKKKKKNEEESGKGDEWAQEWQNNKDEVYYDAARGQLLEYLNDVDRDINLTNKGDEEAGYIMVLKIDKIETGFYGGVVYGDAVLDSRLIIKQKGSKNPKTVLKLEGIESGEFMTARQRLEASYGETGREYGKWLRDKLEQ